MLPQVAHLAGWNDPVADAADAAEDIAALAREQRAQASPRMRTIVSISQICSSLAKGCS
jgi:hypothetical protein